MCIPAPLGARHPSTHVVSSTPLGWGGVADFWFVGCWAGVGHSVERLRPLRDASAHEAASPIRRFACCCLCFARRLRLSSDRGRTVG
eukprot:2226078-Alexandrium_andersonii.AAC.1